MVERRRKNVVRVVRENSAKIPPDGEECIDVLDEERVFEMVETKSKVDAKRRKDGSDKPPAKRKKLENLVDWGQDEEVGKDVPETDVSSWLLSKEIVAVNLDMEITRMKQLELDLVAKRKKTVKKLAKENHKVTNWLNPKPKPSVVVPTVVVVSTATP